MPTHLRSRRAPWLALPASLLLPALAAAGGVAVFQGPAGGVGDVRVCDELSGALLGTPQALQGIRLLPIDFVGRTELQEFLPGRPRRIADIAGAARLRLAAGHGSLYRFVRPEAGGGANYGFLHLRHDGDAAVVLELPGIGSAADADPFVRRIAVAPASDALLVATLPGAGGNLLEIDLESGTVFDRTAAFAPLAFGSAGLALTDQLGAGVHAGGVLRFDRSGSSGAAAVVLPASTPPDWYSRELMTSRNGQWFLTSAGRDVDHQHAYVFGATGPAARASTQPARIAIAGFAPEARSGPYMAVSDDGLQAAWCIETALTRELLLARVQPPAGQEPTQVSSDASFLDTLDEIGLAIFRPSGALHVAVGKAPAGVAHDFEAFDTYHVTLGAAGAPAFVNLSLFSGDAVAPFSNAPQVKPEAWRLLPDEQTLLLFDGQQQDGELLAVRPGLPNLSLIGNIKSLDGFELAGRELLVDLRRSDGNRPQELYRVPIHLAQPAALLLSLPDGTSYGRYATRRDGGIAFVSRAPAGPETLWRAQLSSGVLQSWNPAPLSFGAALGLTALGSFAFSLEASHAYAVWPAGAQPGVSLALPAVAGQVLPAL